MTKWSRLKAAVFAATAVMAALQFGGCLNFGSLLGGDAAQKIMTLVAIGDIFD